MSWRHVLVALAATVCGAAVVSAAQQPEPTSTPSVKAQPTTGPIHVDGQLNEPDWALAPLFGPLRQRDPLEDQVATEVTDVRVLYDEEALYFGIICRDREPSAVVSTQLTRDANLDVDDRITIVIDPFFDHRDGYFFQVNPSGARADGQLSNNQQELTRNWDGIWDASARRTPEGWLAEIKIPFKTLRFKPGQTIWGLNIERHVKRKNENDRWASARLNVWVGNLSEAGLLTGLSGIRQGVGLDLRPYVSGGEDNHDGEFTGGLDVFKAVTPSLNASVTVNTDFAETEVDARQVNLTRFPLFFPEKRAFFLEGAGVFDVAGLGEDNDIIPFFTRRVGLRGDSDSSQQVPIGVGAKLVGRQSGYNVGILDVETRHAPPDPAGGFDALDPQNLLSARVSRNFFRQSWIGGIVTHGNPDGNGANTLVGADARLATSSFRGHQNLALDLFMERTDDQIVGHDYAGGLGVEYPNDVWDVSATWKQIGERFEPALGFVPRTGIRKSSVRVAFQPRPGRLGFRQFFFEFEPKYITNLQNRVENWRIFTAPFNTRTESGEHLEWNYVPEFEHLDAPFEISPGIVIPAGSYQWTRFRAEANTATKRRVVVDFAYWWGGFYDGTRRQLGVGITLKPDTHILLAARVDRNDISLVEGKFYTQVLSLRGDYNFTPNVSLQNFWQYDNESRILGIQSRFRWILKPGNDLFVVVNRGWFKNFDDVYEPSFDNASAKLQYTIRL